MYSIFKSHGIYSIKQLGIVFNDGDVGDLYYGDNSFTLPVKMPIGKYFFKFFLAEDIKNLESEIFILKFLQRKGLRVPEFLEIANNELFNSIMMSQINTVFYATKLVEGAPMSIISLDNLYKVMDYVSLLHEYCAEIDIKKIKLRYKTDHQNLVELYLSNFLFFNKKCLGKDIEYFINLIPHESKRCPIHSDIYYKNIFFSEEHGMTLIDFSDMRVGYLEDDLGRFFQYILYEKNVDISIISLLIKAYERVSKFTISRRNIYISIIFNTIYRYFFDSQFDKNNHYHNITKNLIKVVRSFAS